MNKTVKTILILLVIITVGLIPYYSIKNNIELSNETLSSIGSYISGIVGVLNLFVFVYLTNLVSKYDETKSSNEIKIQKVITQTHFRQSELEKLISELEKPFENSNVEFLTVIVAKYVKASIYLNNFLNQKQHLFPILQNRENLELGNKINDLFVKMIEQTESLKNNNEERENLFEEIHEAKNNFIHLLQSFIINELEQ